ncbi:MAG: S8 family peptidase, partial [Firmicutes bacterium]|nr:S8 family peptidase [Bacillota bacterium]
LRKHRLVSAIALDGRVSKLPLLEEGDTSSGRTEQEKKEVSTSFKIAEQGQKASETRPHFRGSFFETQGFGTTIAVLDTGVSPHYDLVKPQNRIVAFKDFINNKLLPYDDDGHGTHVAGIAAGNGYINGRLSGTAPMANIAAIKCLDENGGGAVSDILAGMQWVAENKNKYNIRVINLSLGINVYEEDFFDPLVIATAALTRLGIVVVTAAGNSGPGKCTITSPGTSPYAVTVGSCKGRKAAEFSSRGPTLSGLHKPDLLAPGVDIVSLDSETCKNYSVHSGTSMSAPFVSGICACILSENPKLMPHQVKNILFRMLTPLSGLSRDVQGRGALIF